MNLVRLIQIAMAADAFEQERNERRVVLSRELGEDALESGSVISAEIWGYLHSGEHDLYLRILCLRLVDDLLEICFHRFQFEPAQAIVRAQLDHENVDGPLEQPINPPQAARTGVAAQARVLNFERQTGCANFFRDQCWERLCWLNAKPCRQAVAEKHNGFCGRFRGARIREFAIGRKKRTDESNCENCWQC